MKRGMAWILVLAALAWTPTPAGGGESVEGAFRHVDEAVWGFSQETMEKALEGVVLYSGRGVLIAPWKFGDHPGTVNYLFHDDGLYNLSWYTTYPVAQAGVARNTKRSMDRLLAKRYGPAVAVKTDGDFRRARAVAADSEELARRRARTYRDYRKKKEEGVSPEILKTYEDELRALLPETFYLEMTLYDNEEFSAYTVLVCSTDGGCYLHLQIVNQERAGDRRYRGDDEDTLNEPLIWRELGRVIESNKAWIRRLRQLGRPAEE